MPGSVENCRDEKAVARHAMMNCVRESSGGNLAIDDLVVIVSKHRRARVRRA
jgi:hypothetical protein